MEYDSESSLDGRSKEREEQRDRQQQAANGSATSWRLLPGASNASTSSQTKKPLEATLSAQVMEYYQKYSQNSNLNQYFSLPTSSNNAAESAKYYYSIYELSPKYVPGRQSCIGQDYNLKSYIPRERRRWVRPPLIGQSSSTDGSSVYVKSMTEPQTPRFDERSKQHRHHQQQQQNSSTSTEGVVITEEKSTETSPQDQSERKAPSPTSSVTSHKPLEWDSGADVGYLYAAASGNGDRLSDKLQQLSTLERMALARGCSAALRLDPEGTTEQQQSPGSIRTTVTAAVLSLTTRTSAGGNGLSKAFLGKPDANSTSLIGNVSGSESEIEITPIVKNHLPGIVTAEDVRSNDIEKCRKELIKDKKDSRETPKSSNAFKLPHSLKYTTAEDSKLRPKVPPPLPIASTSKDSKDSDNSANYSPLKKSSSMNLLASPTSRVPLKRSQSELNLCGNDKAAPRLIFNSTSSIATVVNNKPSTCNKLIQTSLKQCMQESVGIQVSELKEEEKPPLPKRATSLASNQLNSILKNSKSTYKVENPKTANMRQRAGAKEERSNDKEEESSSESSHNVCVTPPADDTENVTGRANSFEYFPGHIYENVPNGSTSQVSSVDTGRSTSTVPNTSSSVDEKLWGDSDSLVRDLERSVNILKSLVDANKLDKQVKKRLIHHVVKRLVTAKYADDKIERDLGENVPWNPADARNKVYRREIIQALAKNTTDSSDDWKPTQKKTSKKPACTSETRAMKDIIDMPAEIESSNSDKFDRNTDRTEMDGRKARMGLRTDECERRCSSRTPTNKSDQSSECFLPQRGYKKKEKVKDMFISSTTNSSPQDQNRALLETVASSRRSPVNTSNDACESGDWRLPTTMSERRYQMRRCSNSESGDSKLVTYAEMEKRNQLVWITNEISHLSNLKKLLEQPKTKSERPSKISPRKSKQSCSKPQKSLTHHDHLQNGDADSNLNKQWSSHCNLASCSTPPGSVRRLKKRNSCTQTATDSLSAYSRTGSEIVSARIESPNKKLVSVCVQTPKAFSSVAIGSSIPQLHSDCPLHQTATLLSCSCNERVCQYCKSKNERHGLRGGANAELSYNEIKLSCKESEDTKETKNQLNVTKLQCTCQNVGKENCKHTDERPKKSTTASQTCNSHPSKDYVHSSRNCKLLESSSCQCSRDCKCENRKCDCGYIKLACRCGKIQVNNVPEEELFEKMSNATCPCGFNKTEDTQSPRSECNFHSNKKAQPYFLANSNKQSKSHNCCCTNNKAKDRSKTYPSPQHSVRTNSSSSSDCKICRVCGTTYQNNRICGCVPKRYPKGVAYELSFVNDKNTNICNDEINIEIKSIDKNGRLQEKLNCEVENDECARSQNVIKNHCDCGCKENKPRKFNKKCTLQDYLAYNNPGFADNVETRRQYVSEIQRLRQIRKDRRVQLLAMATTTNIFSPYRPTKVTKNLQRKISDEEMRERRRKRYFQLTEVRAKRKQQQLQEEARCNKLMAKIFCKKLQQKVLKGQVDLSQSMSVISNL